MLHSTVRTLQTHRHLLNRGESQRIGIHARIDDTTGLWTGERESLHEYLPVVASPKNRRGSQCMVNILLKAPDLRTDEPQIQDSQSCGVRCRIRESPLRQLLPQGVKMVVARDARDCGDIQRTHKKTIYADSNLQSATRARPYSK